MTAPDSSLARAVEVVGDRWSLLVVDALMTGSLRFNDLVEAIGGIAPNILSQRIKHLEREGILVARPYSTRPPRFSYELSASGKELAGVLRLLSHWGSGRAEAAEPLRHAACGTPMEARWFCPTCAVPVDDNDDTQVRYV
ncbi:MAG: helix-turn-helix transcriptional regulator [Actinomycetota bacterium]|nr:helix-turn-helix transcriptional regulator [Actinomycetota bacterium]